MTHLQPHLTQLETSGLLRLAHTEPEMEYLFRHALIQDAAYESLLKADRRALHRAIGEALERLYSDRLNELAPTLGQHFAEAGEDEKAVRYLLAAGDKASAIYAYPEALAAFELAAQQEARMGRRWYRAQTLREWAEAHLSRHAPGDLDRARDLLREAHSEFTAMNVPKYAALIEERLRALQERK